MQVSGNGTTQSRLGGLQGYGEIEVPRGDDNAMGLDISAVFENGLNYFGTTYAANAVFVNTNGFLSFGQPFADIPTSQNNLPVRDLIAPFWGDVDTRLDGEGTESGAIWVDIDPIADVVSLTWHRVGAYRRNADDTNTFQLQLFDRGNGNFDIVFRYTQIDWTIGTSNHDTGSRIGIFSANLADPIRIEIGIGHSGLQALPDIFGNTGVPGLWLYEMRGGVLEQSGSNGPRLTGTNGSDSLTGTEFNDTIEGLAGDDHLWGGGGNDSLNGGLGNDYHYGGAGLDTVIFNLPRTGITVLQVNDGLRITSTAGTDFIADDVENFQFSDGIFTYAQMQVPNAVDSTGTSGADILQGGEGNDILRGLDGTDTLIGNAGNDTLIGGTSVNDLRDVIYGGAGDDTIDGGYGNDELRGDAGSDIINGGFGADRIIGGTGNDALGGGALGDEIFGGDGFDFVNGGWGHDRVNGGAGADQFFHIGIFDHGSDWIQDYDAAEGDVLVWGGAAATADDFQINLAHTADNAGERSGDDTVQEAFVVYRPTGQIMWALVDGGGQAEINISIGGNVFDLLG